MTTKVESGAGGTASIAALMLTTEALVTDLPRRRLAAPVPAILGMGAPGPKPQLFG
jgi:hypothetical protein